MNFNWLLQCFIYQLKIVSEILLWQLIFLEKIPCFKDYCSNQHCVISFQNSFVFLDLVKFIECFNCVYYIHFYWILKFIGFQLPRDFLHLVEFKISSCFQRQKNHQSRYDFFRIHLYSYQLLLNHLTNLNHRLKCWHYVIWHYCQLICNFITGDYDF